MRRLRGTANGYPSKPRLNKIFTSSRPGRQSALETNGYDPVGSIPRNQTQSQLWTEKMCIPGTHFVFEPNRLDHVGRQDDRFSWRDGEDAPSSPSKLTHPDGTKPVSTGTRIPTNAKKKIPRQRRVHPVKSLSRGRNCTQRSSTEHVIENLTPPPPKEGGRSTLNVLYLGNRKKRR